MRNPKRRRDVAALLVVIGISAIAIPLGLHHDETPSQGAWFGIVLAGFIDLALAATAFTVFNISYRQREKLLAGYKQLAKWTVSPAELQQFRANEKRHKDVGRNNSLNVRKQSDVVGFDVIVSQEAVMADEDFYVFTDRRGLQWLPDVPPSLEFNMVTANKNGSLRWNIRIPVPSDAEASARIVWDYFNRPTIAPNLTKRYRAMRKFGLICLLIAQLPLLFAVVNPKHVPLQTSVIVAIIIGAIGSFIGIFAALLAQMLLKKSKAGPG
ncbi:MAG: hypothetical protein ABJB66_16085 [Gemmatimonadaceae bacterium]